MPSTLGRTRRTRTALRAGTLSLFLGAAVAAPPQARAEDAVAVAEARQRYLEGQKLHVDGREEEAYAKFVQAYAVLKNQHITFNLARTEQLTGRLVDASTHFRLYLQNDHDESVQGKRQRELATAYFSEIRAKIGRLQVDAPRDADVVIDGKVVSDRAPFTEPLELMPGPRIVEIRRGTQTKVARVTIEAGQLATVSLSFDAEAGAGPAVVPPPPSATTAPPAQQPPGAEQQPTTDWSTTRKAVFWSSVGVGVVGLGAGTLFALDASSKSDDVNAYRAAHPGGCAATSSAVCAGEQSLRDDFHRSVTLSIVGFGAAALGAVGVVYSWRYWPEAAVVPSVGPSSSRVDLVVRF